MWFNEPTSPPHVHAGASAHRGPGLTTTRTRARLLPNELRELGRLGRAMNAGAPAGARRHRRPIAQPFISRRRFHVPRGMVWVLVVISAAVVWVGMAAARQA